MSIYGQFISSSEMVYEVTYSFPTNIDYNCYLLQKIKSNTRTFSLGKINNSNVNVIYYDLKDFVPPCLRSISQNYFNKPPFLHILMEEHDNIMDENNQRKRIEYKISVSIVMKYTTYDYND